LVRVSVVAESCVVLAKVGAEAGVVMDAGARLLKAM
jgi:hypothetical protein